MHTALTIAGSDSGGGAGIQADLKTFAAFGVYGTSAITAVTAQNTERVSAVLALPPDIVAAQIDAVADDIEVDAVKVGMLANADIVRVVSDALDRHQFRQVVVDPVMLAKSGDRLLSNDAICLITERLLRLATVVTPNRSEAETLAGMTIRTESEAREAAARIHRFGPTWVVIKGGHFEGDVLTNLLFDGSSVTPVQTRRLTSRHTHGTGCTFASALAALLARGNGVVDAAREATEYVAGAIAGGLALGRGHGPLHHFWRGVRPLG